MRPGKTPSKRDPREVLGATRNRQQAPSITECIRTNGKMRPHLQNNDSNEKHDNNYDIYENNQYINTYNKII